MSETLYRVLIKVDGTEEKIPLSPEEVAQVEADRAAIAAFVPTSVTPYQARVALLDAGLLDAVEALIVDPDTPKAAKLAWEYATTIQRDSVFIQTLGPALNLTSNQIDDLFRSAAQIT